MREDIKSAWLWCKEYSLAFMVKVTRTLLLVSGLPDCPWDDIKEAAKETFVNFIFSTMRHHFSFVNSSCGAFR